MKQSEGILDSLPEDIALKIASCLQVGDLCALGSCSRLWRDLCRSDFLWESLTRQRWPSLDVFAESSSFNRGDSSSFKGWKDFYVKRHTDMAERAMLVVQQVEQCSFSDLLAVRDYVKEIELLKYTRLGFKDVVIFLFRPEVNVLLNFIGLLYCVHWLEVPAEHVMEAIRNNKIAQRRVSVRWLKLCRLFYDFQRADESHSHSVSLQDLVLHQENEVLGVLGRHAIRAILRFQISVVSLSRKVQIHGL